MGMWTALALVAIAGCALEAYRVRANAQKKFAKNDELAELETRIKQLDEELRKRVEVLERIVTDSKADLKREFDYLDKAS